MLLPGFAIGARFPMGYSIICHAITIIRPSRSTLHPPPGAPLLILNLPPPPRTGFCILRHYRLDRHLHPTPSPIPAPSSILAPPLPALRPFSTLCHIVLPRVVQVMSIVSRALSLDPTERQTMQELTASIISLSERQLEKEAQISSSAAAEAISSPEIDAKAVGVVAEAIPPLVELPAEEAVRLPEVVAVDTAVADDHGATTAAAAVAAAAAAAVDVVTGVATAGDGASSAPVAVAGSGTGAASTTSGGTGTGTAAVGVKPASGDGDGGGGDGGGGDGGAASRGILPIPPATRGAATREGMGTVRRLPPGLFVADGVECVPRVPGGGGGICGDDVGGAASKDLLATPVDTRAEAALKGAPSARRLPPGLPVVGSGGASLPSPEPAANAAAIASTTANAIATATATATVAKESVAVSNYVPEGNFATPAATSGVVGGAGEGAGGGCCTSGGDDGGEGDIGHYVIPEQGQAPVVARASEEATPRVTPVEDDTAASGSVTPPLKFPGHAPALHVDGLSQAMPATLYTALQEKHDGDGSGICGNDRGRGSGCYGGGGGYAPTPTTAGGEIQECDLSLVASSGEGGSEGYVAKAVTPPPQRRWERGGSEGGDGPGGVGGGEARGEVEWRGSVEREMAPIPRPENEGGWGGGDGRGKDGGNGEGNGGGVAGEGRGEAAGGETASTPGPERYGGWGGGEGGGGGEVGGEGWGGGGGGEASPRPRDAREGGWGDGEEGGGGGGWNGKGEGGWQGKKGASGSPRHASAAVSAPAAPNRNHQQHHHHYRNRHRHQSHLANEKAARVQGYVATRTAISRQNTERGGTRYGSHGSGSCGSDSGSRHSGSCSSGSSSRGNGGGTRGSGSNGGAAAFRRRRHRRSRGNASPRSGPPSSGGGESSGVSHHNNQAAPQETGTVRQPLRRGGAARTLAATRGQSRLVAGGGGGGDYFCMGGGGGTGGGGSGWRGHGGYRPAPPSDNRQAWCTRNSYCAPVAPSQWPVAGFGPVADQSTSVGVAGYYRRQAGCGGQAWYGGYPGYAWHSGYGGREWCATRVGYANCVR